MLNLIQLKFNMFCHLMRFKSCLKILYEEYTKHVEEENTYEHDTLESIQ